ncbi:hypothetical protein DSL72_002058 [Monilinia vaccinii-corymbosi]|uniref:Uncharacterized protein n=1 Tax=Monilinia vaccinii-corymbosi TaxID=61207 RepID=A0A8A3PBJ6_9HELO|nr:hypothetical protein DSL72_002058 [Monilinia vaccinii-corymbosi]
MSSPIRTSRQHRIWTPSGTLVDKQF